MTTDNTTIETMLNDANALLATVQAENAAKNAPTASIADMVLASQEVAPTAPKTRKPRKPATPNAAMTGAIVSADDSVNAAIEYAQDTANDFDQLHAMAFGSDFNTDKFVHALHGMTGKVRGNLSTLAAQGNVDAQKALTRLNDKTATAMHSLELALTTARVKQQVKDAAAREAQLSKLLSDLNAAESLLNAYIESQDVQAKRLAKLTDGTPEYKRVSTELIKVQTNIINQQTKVAAIRAEYVQVLTNFKPNAVISTGGPANSKPAKRSRNKRG